MYFVRKKGCRMQDLNTFIFFVSFDVLIGFFILILFAVSVPLGVRLGGLVDSGGKR